MNNLKRVTQIGFTLIELMIVIAIIGILAAIALPAYTDYIARTQATEGLVSTSGLRNEVSLYFWEHKKYPPADSLILDAAQELEGKYYDAKGVVLTPNTGVINVNFNKGANQGNVLTLTPKANAATGQTITWICGGSVGIKRTPTTCQ